MPLSLPPSLIAKKNAVAGDGAWLTLFEIFAPTETLYLVPNNEDITWNGNVYEAFALEVGELKQQSDGSFISFQVGVANQTQAVQPYLEETHGLVGCKCRLIVVNSSLLNEVVADLICVYDIIGAEADEDWVRFTLGRPSLFKRRFPPFRAQPRSCPLRFGKARCGYSGSEFTSCGGTLDDCRERGNSVRFGGRPGLQAKGARYI
ncbi:hypothetical protein [Propionivibrio dicarboxylicus]|uniref:Phage-related protein n=1 Tax=Propionivibrio dicarboxylicus TaxID=83767 RepID=A0A1G8LEM6_9RHOO|nr:hypothetical protein [Propionivibrio dicarboxylicus]SDI54086.1 Phage-related protein [Propionivibrio dicarboxylicus]